MISSFLGRRAERSLCSGNSCFQFEDLGEACSTLSSTRRRQQNARDASVQRRRGAYMIVRSGIFKSDLHLTPSFPLRLHSKDLLVLLYDSSHQHHPTQRSERKNEPRESKQHTATAQD